MKIFRHSGATGDMIFSLPVVRDLGGGDFYIGQYDNQRAEGIAELLRVQPYINSITIGQPAHLDHDLDMFRVVFKGANDNLIEAHYRGQNMEVGEYKDGWLTLPDRPKLIEGPYCIINRTARYQDERCDWAKELDYLRTIAERIIFIGYHDEYLAFTNRYGYVEYIDVSFLEGAYLLRDCSMFTGNYSAWATIAQGLGIRYRLEQAPGHTCSTLFIDRETIINA